jgi:hypothetical protein
VKARKARFKETAMTKKTRFAFALLGIVLLGCSVANAQKPASKIAPATTGPDLTKLNLEKILQELQSTNVQGDGQEVSPLEVVAAFLQLRPGQATELQQLVQARQATITPLLTEAQTLIQQLAILLNSGGNPAQIGTALIQIHTLQQKIGQAQQAFLTQFASTLDPDQWQKLQAVQVAAQLQPILPAFAPIFLF